MARIVPIHSTSESEIVRSLRGFFQIFAVCPLARCKTHCGVNARLLHCSCNAIAAALQNWINARLDCNRTSERRLVGLERVLERFIGGDLIIEKGGANIGRNYVRSPSLARLI